MLDFVVTEDAKLDVGTISRSFGLNPSSLKFNDIYVSRGPDFISSVTWSNLTASLNPILVEGKPCEPYGFIDGTFSELKNYDNQMQQEHGNGTVSMELTWLNSKDSDRREYWFAG